MSFLASKIGCSFIKATAGTAIDAAAADLVHAVVADDDSGLVGAENIQALAIALSARIKAIEPVAP